MPAGSDDDGQRRRTVLRTTGGALGFGLLADTAGAEQRQQGQEEGPQIAMATVADTQALVFRTPLIWVEAGTTVTWVLESGSHSTTAYAPANDKPRRIPEGAGAWDSGVLSEQGATFTNTFDADGVYDYYCTPHEAAGMIGRVVVGSPDVENQPALAQPQDDLPAGARDVIEALNALTRSSFGLEGGQ